MEEQKIQAPINEKDKNLIQATFGDETLLKAIRALFFGLGPTEEEKALVKNTFASTELRELMWRRFLPSLNKDAPIGQVQDVWLGVEQMVFGYNPDTIYQAVHYKRAAIDMTRQALTLLEDPSGKVLNLTYTPPIGPLSDKDVSLQTGLLARNQFIRHVEQQLLFLKLIADQKPQTPLEQSKKSTKNSAK